MNSTLKAAWRISAVTLGSRVLGLARDVMMFWMLGFSWATGTFLLAWMIPNLLRRLFGEGALSASFIPAYTKVGADRGPTAAKQLLSSVTGLLLLVLGAITVLVLLACFFLPGETIGRSGDGVSAHRQGELLLELTIILFPYAIPICLAAIFAGALNTHGSFAIGASAPIVLNLFWIGGLAVAWGNGLTDSARIVTLVAVFLLVGGIAQMSLSLIPLIRRGCVGPPRLPAAGDPAMGVVRNMGPTVIGMSLVQINTMLDQALAFYFVGPGAPAFIYAANRLLLFPHALTSLSLATAVFPRFARLAADGDRVGLRREVDRALHHTVLVALPAAVGMMLVARPLIEVMFEGSERIAGDDIVTASLTTVCLVASLPTIGIAQLHARALYALGDYRTPAWMSFWLLLLNVVLNTVFVLVLGLGVPGFALATTVASVVNAVGLRRKLTRACPDGDPRRPAMALTFVACAVMGLAVYGMLQWITATSRMEKVVYDLMIPIGVGMVVYAGLQFVLGQRTLRLR